MKVGIFFGIIFLSCNVAFAGRPLSTDDAGTVAPGHLEVELGTEYVKMSEREKEYALSAVFTTGLFIDRFEFCMELPFIWLDYDQRQEDGFGDLQAVVKYRFMDEKDFLPALAITVGVKTCTGDCLKGLGTGETDFVANVIATKEFGVWTVYANIGYNYTGDPVEEAAYDFINCSFAGEYAVNGKFCLVGEIVTEFAIDDIDQDNSVEILFGAVYEIPCGMVLDFGIAFGLTDGAPDNRITIGLTHEF